MEALFREPPLNRLLHEDPLEIDSPFIPVFTELPPSLPPTVVCIILP